jgi:HicB family
MPTGLHGELARAADREGVSLNQFISSALAGAVGWAREDGGVAPGPPSTAAKPRSRWLMLLLAANLVLVAAAAASAIVFLVAAWLSR